jgi:hypothetical protein
MPKIKCVCGNIISLNQIPSPNQFLMISDVKLDKFQGRVDVEELYLAMDIVVHCNICQRLHVYSNGFEQPAIIYKIDLE